MHVAAAASQRPVCGINARRKDVDSSATVSVVPSTAASAPSRSAACEVAVTANVRPPSSREMRLSALVFDGEPSAVSDASGRDQQRVAVARRVERRPALRHQREHRRSRMRVTARVRALRDDDVDSGRRVRDRAGGVAAVAVERRARALDGLRVPARRLKRRQSVEISTLPRTGRRRQS